MVLLFSLRSRLPHLFGSRFNVDLLCDEAAGPEEEEMKKTCFNCKYKERGYQEFPCCLCNVHADNDDMWEPAE